MVSLTMGRVVEEVAATMSRSVARLGALVKRTSDALGVLRNFIWLFATLVAAGVVGYLGLAQHPALRTIAVVSCAILGGLALGYVCGQVVERRRTGSLGSRIVNYTIEYHFDDTDPRKQKHVVTIELLALLDGLGIYEGRYGWSGTGNDTGPRIVAGDARIIIAPPAPVTGWRRYYVIFDRPLRRGKKITFKFEHDLFDSSGTFVPFLAKSLDQRIDDKLSLSLVFPRSLPPDGSIVACVRSANPASKAVIQEDDLRYDARNKTVAFDFVKPKVGMRYSIEWAWPEYADYCVAKQGS